MNYTVSFRFLSIFFGLCFYLVSTCYAQQVLPLSDFISLSVQNHPIHQKTNAQYMATLQEQLSVNGIRDWNLFLNYSYGKGAASSFSPTFSTKNTVHNASISARKSLIDWGAQLSVSTRYTSVLDAPALEFGDTSIPIPNNHNYSIDISIRQPLLKNLKGSLDQYPLDIANNNKEIARYIYNDDIETFIATLTQDYLNWRLSYKKKHIFQQQYENAEKQVALLTKQVARGSAEKRELLQAQQHAQSRKLHTLQENQHYTILARQISSHMVGKAMLGPTSMIPETEVLIPSIEKRPPFDITEESHTAKLLNTQINIQNRTVRYYEEQEKHGLDLVAKTSVLGLGTSNKNAQQDIGKNTTYSLGVDYELPLQNTQNHHLLERAKEHRNASIATKKETLLKLKLYHTELLNQIDVLQTMITTSKTLYDLSLERETLENDAYKQGRLSSFYFVINAQDQTLAAKLQLEEYTHRYHSLKNTLAALEDTYINSYQLKELP